MYRKEILTDMTDTRLVCCSGDSQCEKARIMLPELPKLLRDPEICELFKPLDLELERKIRAIYVGANFEDGGELFRKIAKQPAYVRAQAEFAVCVTDEPAFQTSRTRWEAGMLVARVFAGTGFNVRELEPDRIGNALESTSIDCFAGIAEKCFIEGGNTPSSLEESGADAVELGLLAIIRFLSKANLTDTEFRRLVKRASTGPHYLAGNNETTRHKIPGHWPPAPGWNDSYQYCDGALFKPIFCLLDLRSEGIEMHNCLQRGTYDQDALLGRLAFFSIVTGRSRATLSLELLTREDENGLLIAEAYTIDDIKGERNSAPAPACKNAAFALLRRLNENLPSSLDQNEIARRNEVEASFQARSRSFCRDLKLAEDHWKRIYLPALPARLRHCELADIVDRLQDYE